MPVLTAPALVAAALIALAGAQKLLDPTMTVGALRALRLPSTTDLVRAGSAAEMALGVAALVIGGAPLWWLVSLSYVAFAGFVVAALSKGTMIGSCGCFGREDTPPHWVHVVLNIALAGVAGAVATHIDGSLVTVLSADPARAALVIAMAGLTLYLIHAVYVVLPRTLAVARPIAEER